MHGQNHIKFKAFT